MTSLLISAIIALSGALVSMFMFWRKDTKKRDDQNSQNIAKMTEAMLKNSISTDANTQVSKEIYNLLHTINTNVLLNGKK